MTKILITGGLGFIGRQVAALLVKQQYTISLFDNLNAQVHGVVPDLSSLQLLHDPRITVLRGDVRSRSDWEDAVRECDCIIHLAAETGTAQSMYEIHRYSETNIGGASLLLDILANSSHCVGKLILASSRSVYGEGAYECADCEIVSPPMRSAKALSEGRWNHLCPQCGGATKAIPTPEHAPTVPASIYAATKLAQEYQFRIAGSALG